MIELTNVSVVYGDVVAVKPTTRRFLPGVTAITGPSGSGKSSILRVMAGILAPSSGSVMLNGEPVARPTWRSAGDRRVAIINQDFRLVPFLTVGENLRLAAEVRDMPVDKTMLGEALERAGASSIGLARMPATLSGGEQQRVVIARTLIHDAEVVLADEPTGSLDSENSLIIANQLAAIGRSGKVVVVATHDPAVMATLESSLRLVDGVLEGERVTV